MIKVITRNNNTIEVTATRTLPKVIIYGLNKSLAILHDV